MDRFLFAALPAIRQWTLAAALTLLAACAAPPDAGPATAGASPGEQLQRLAQRHQICAAAVAVIRQRQLQSVTTASGCSPALAVRADSVFQSASLGKPVFAYAVLKLVREGRLALDAPVLQYLPQGYRHAFDPLQPGLDGRTDEVTDPRLRSVTVRMLLQHTAGFANWARGPLRFDAEPGARWMYSGEGYVLLQRAVEAVTGQPLDELMREQVFTPLGMTHSSYRWTREIAERLLPGTKANGAPRKTLALRQPVAAFSLYTSVEDYARFLLALLNDPALSAQIADAPVEVDPALNLAWGLGWGLEQADDGVHLWQWGNNPGYRAFAIASPGSGDALVMLSNSDGGLKMAAPLVRAAMPGEHPVLRSPFLSEGLWVTLCEALRLCF